MDNDKLWYKSWGSALNHWLDKARRQGPKHDWKLTPLQRKEFASTGGIKRSTRQALRRKKGRR